MDLKVLYYVTDIWARYSFIGIKTVCSLRESLLLVFDAQVNPHWSVYACDFHLTLFYSVARTKNRSIVHIIYNIKMSIKHQPRVTE